MAKLLLLFTCLLSVASGGTLPFLRSRSYCQDLSNGDCQMRNEAPLAGHRRQLLVDSTGVLNILVLPIIWTDLPADRTLATTEQLDELWNGVGDGENFPSGSIANWTNVNSHGSLTLKATVAPWVTVDNTEIYYAGGNSGRPNNPNGIHVYDAINYALGQLQSQGFDFSPFDQNGDGILDAVSVMHSGYAAEMRENDCSNGRGFLDRIQSHFSVGPEEGGWSGPNGLRLGPYTIASALMGYCGTEMARLGIAVHEFIHLFGFPELYDVKVASEGSASSVGGVGGFDVMYVSKNQLKFVIDGFAFASQPIRTYLPSLLPS